MPMPITARSQIPGVSIADVADSAHIINGFYKAAVVPGTARGRRNR